MIIFMRLFINLKLKGFILGGVWVCGCGAFYVNDKQDMLCELDSLLTRFKQSKESLNKPCCDNLFETVKTKIPSFEDAAPHFGFKEPAIVEIRKDCSSERQRRLLMLWKWKAKNGSDATYLAIVKVFLSMENKQLTECVLEFCREKEVPSIDSHVNPSKVKKYRNWESMSNFEQEKITNNLHVENEEIRMKYSFLVDNFLISLEKRNIPVDRLKLFLASYGVPQATLLNASTLAEVLLIIQMSYSSWFNIQLFERIVEKFGSNDDKGNMRVYAESDLVPYLQRSIFEIPSKSFDAGNETTDRISLGLYLPDEVIPTGKDVAIIKNKLSQLLGITDEILQFRGYDPGSTILIFRAPAALLNTAVFQSVIEEYFTPDITKRIYTFIGDLAQVLPPGIHQEGSIVHRNLKEFHGNTQTTSSSQITYSDANMSDSEIQILLDDSDFQETCQMGKELIKAVQGLLGTRKLTLSLLHTLKKDVEESYDRSRNARIGGTAATVTGSALAIAGFGLSFFTFGASLGLLIPGAVIAGAGGVAIIGAEIGYLAISQTKLRDANNACKADREQMIEVKELGEKFFKQLDFLAKKLNSTWEKIFVFVRHSWSSRNGLKALYGGYKAIDAVFEAGKVVGSAIKAARIAAVGGRTVALLPVDLAVMVKSAYDVHKYRTEGESNSNVAKEIGQLIKDLEINRDELQKFSDELGTAV